MVVSVPASIEVVGGYRDDALRAAVLQEACGFLCLEAYNYVAPPRIWFPRPCNHVHADIQGVCEDLILKIAVSVLVSVRANLENLAHPRALLHEATVNQLPLVPCRWTINV